MMAITWQAQDTIEPIGDSTIEAIANIANYSVVSGCAVSYSVTDMVATIASGSVLHNGSTVAVAGNTVTLVSDPTNPRWVWIGVNSSGTAERVLGDPAVAPAVPELDDNVCLALVLVEAAQTVANNITYKLDKRVIAPQRVLAKYKSATQVFTTTTALADVTASSGTFSFPIAASEVWLAEYWIPVSFGGTGGVKFQISGPAAATSVDITGEHTIAQVEDAGGGINVFMLPFTAVTAFATNIAAADSQAAPGTGVYSSSVSTIVLIRLRVINGANAGTVTLQAAQNSSNSTTTLGIGCTMQALKVA